MKEIKIPDNKSEKTNADDEDDDEQDITPERGVESSPEKPSESP